MDDGRAGNATTIDASTQNRTFIVIPVYSAACACPSRLLSDFSKPSAASAITVPGGKIASTPGAPERVVVLRRHHAADHDHDVAAAEPFELGLQLGDVGEVGGGERRDADDVHVALDRLPRGFLRRREQRADHDVEAEILERRRDHLLAAVVAVLAGLGDQDARAAAFGARRMRP